MELILNLTQGNFFASSSWEEERRILRELLDGDDGHWLRTDKIVRVVKPELCQYVIKNYGQLYM